MKTSHKAGLTSPFLCAVGLLVGSEGVAPPAPACPRVKSDHYGTYRPATAEWRLNGRRPGWIESGPGEMTFVFGNPGDTPLIGDWDGNGSQTPGIWRAGTFELSNTLGGSATVTVTSGTPPYVPVVGDWDGDQTTTVGTFDEGIWTLLDANTASAGETSVTFGRAGDIPVIGDWNGDGSMTVGVFRPSDAAFYLRNSNTNGPAELVVPAGLPGDTPVVGDWDGDGVTTVGIRRGSSFQVRNSNTPGRGELIFGFGAPTDQPLVGNWGSSAPVFPTAPATLRDFFPLAIDYQPISTMGAWKAEGINTLMRIPADADMDTWTLAANAHGLKMMRPARPDPDADDTEPNLLAWAIADEPELSLHLENMRQEYQRLRPFHSRPIFFNFAGLRVWQTIDTECNGPGDGGDEHCYPDYIATEDWVSNDIYAVNSLGSRDSIRLVGETLSKLRRWSRDRPQFAYIETSRLSDQTRAPTPAELRAQVWSAIIHGARGILYFPLGRCDAAGVCREFNATPPAVQAEMRRENARITSLASILQGTINPSGIGIATPTPLEATWRTSGSERYFFVLNLSATPTTQTMTVCGDTPSAAITVMGENRSVGRAGSPNFSDSFDPYEVHIYRF